MLNIVCIIPARGGSKGILRKNILPVAGHPLLAWSIMAAQDSRYISRVIVSTDDAEIAQVALEYNAEVITRPQEISGDLSSSEEALLHALEQLQCTEEYVADVVVFIQCTSPLTLSSDVDQAIDQYLRNKADVVFSATASHAFLWQVDEKSQAIGINHDIFHRPMRQQRVPEFKETGAFYIMRTSGLLAHKHRFFGKVMLYDVPPERSLDIDEAWELPVAELLLRQRQVE